MAIFYCQTSNMSRSKGHSAVAAAAYRSGSKLKDSRRGCTHDYEGKRGVIGRFLVNNMGLSREVLWNAVEATEKAKNARVAREWQLALPHELDGEAHRRILGDFADVLVKKYGVAIDIAIHAPGEEGDHRNVHAHLLMSCRAINSDGTFGAEKIQMNWSDKRLKEAGLPTGRQQIESLRKSWAAIVNQELKHSGLSERIDYRSLKDQGITDRIPQVHLGKFATQQIRKNESTDRTRTRGQINQLNIESEVIIKRRKNLALQAEGAAFGEFSARRSRRYFSTPEKLNLVWEPAQRAHGALSLFGGKEQGIFRWTRGHAEGRIAFFTTQKTIESYSLNGWALAAQLKLAQAKVEAGEWKSVQLNGSEAFKQRAWLQAQVLGIEVSGYRPTQQDIAIAEVHKNNPTSQFSPAQDEVRTSYEILSKRGPKI
ncbi:MAG TPA: MobA/MobL protein [Spongiibacteraceae bacterium]|nr:MobA/MobL protein [Spongiibacteraceae bacterium]HCS27869.1 MobA/MobL protein [Spongiibacteraceae bacterium]|tara:strand:- start:5231 stop:6511 length:1281 start_codon:yes stop_codon:yes gene_type:complete